MTSADVSTQELKIYCPEHRRASTVAREGVLWCGNGDHVLADKFPPEDFWVYHCDCGGFGPLKYPNGSPVRRKDFDKGGKPDDCWMCGRQIKGWYLCGQCNVLTLESGEPVSIRHFTLPLSEPGSPRPSCPGCLKTTGAPVLEHICDPLFELGLQEPLATPRGKCPFCAEEIRDSGSVSPFPAGSAVAPGPAEPALAASALAPEGGAIASRVGFWQDWPAKRNLWLDIGAAVGLLLGVVSLALALLAYVFPDTPRDVRWQYRRQFSNRPPVLKWAGRINSGTVFGGQNVLLRAAADDPDGDELKFAWQVDPPLGQIEGDRPEATLQTAGINPDTEPIRLKVTVWAKDIYHASAAAPLTFDVVVTSPSISNSPPKINSIVCSNSNCLVEEGKPLTLVATAEDPDGDQLTYSWGPAGRVSGNGPEAVLDTSGIRLQQIFEPVTVTLTVSDQHGRRQPGERVVYVVSKQAAAAMTTQPASSDQAADYEPQAYMLPPEDGRLNFQPGEKVTLQCVGFDPDNDGDLIYEWKTSTGVTQVSDKTIFSFEPDGREEKVEVTLVVRNGRGKKSQPLKTLIKVLPHRPSQPPPSPEATAIPSPRPSPAPDATAVPPAQPSPSPPPD